MYRQLIWSIQAMLMGQIHLVPCTHFTVSVTVEYSSLAMTMDEPYHIITPVLSSGG